jgi:hypothetical protein
MSLVQVCVCASAPCNQSTSRQLLSQRCCTACVLMHFAFTSEAWRPVPQMIRSCQLWVTIRKNHDTSRRTSATSSVQRISNPVMPTSSAKEAVHERILALHPRCILRVRATHAQHNCIKHARSMPRL